MSEQPVQVAHSMERTAQTVKQTTQIVSAVSEELDWATVREAAKLAGVAAMRFVGWWLCGRGFHIWQTYEYEDGTVVEVCISCEMQAGPALAAA